MKFKTLSLMIACLLIVSGTTYAKKKPAGEVIGDSLYHDFKYNFEIKISDGWKSAKIKSENDIYRVAFRKISPIMPAKYSDFPSAFTPPVLTVLVDTNVVSVDSLEALLRAQDSRVAIIKEALKSFQLVSFSQYHPEFNQSIHDQIADLKGCCMQGRKRLGETDFVRGMIYILQNEKYTFMIQAVAEIERFGFNEKDFSNMVKSIVFRADQPESKKIEEKE